MFTDQNLPSYLFGNTNFPSSSDFLDTWSRYDLDAYCLAMLFAYREFDDGVLGLAWVAGTGGNLKEGSHTSTAGISYTHCV